MTRSEYTFAFFPYLKTSGPVLYRSLTIRSSDDFTDLPPDAIRHLETLYTMFFLRDHLRIQKMSYAFHASSEDFSTSEFVQRLVEFQALVRFIYSAPHPVFGDPFLRYEHASLYLLQPTRVSKHLLVDDHNVEILPEAQSLDFDSRSEIEGYSEGTAQPSSPVDLRSIVASLINSVWHYTFMIYFRLEHLRQQKGVEDAAQLVTAPD